jgi:4-amino-4-deoxy-L-arabinose transferase-like glycosyltransferase
MVAAALLLRLILVACVFRDVAAPTVDHERFGWEMGWTARSIALGHGFGSPFLPSTGATALVPPLYPFLLAFVFHLFGLYTAKSALVILSLNSFFSALTCLPIYFSVKQAVGARAAMLAGWSWVVFPYAIYFSADRVWDYALTALLFSTCFWAAQRIHRRSPLSTWFALGLLFGITTLSNPSIATILPILLLFALLRVHRSQHPWLLRGLVTAVTFAAVIAPWALRNYRDLHIISPVRDGFWLEAYAGNNGDTFTSNAPWAHPASNPVEMQRYEAAGEVVYMEQKKQLTQAWIKTHPKAFAAVSLRRVVRFWTGFWSLRRSYLRIEPLDVPNIFFCTFLTVMMFRGLYRWWQQDRRNTLAYIALLILFPLPYYFSHSSPDYRQPIEPEVIALVTIGIFGLREHQNDTDYAQTLEADFESESEDLAGDLILVKS